MLMCQYGMAIRGVFHSVFFSETDMCRWDALLFGEHRRINPDEGDLDKMLNTFHQRPPETAHSARKELHAKILSYAPHVRFELIPGVWRRQLFSSTPRPEGTTVVVTTDSPGPDKILVDLDVPE
jgi:hypothetical protein